MADNVVLPLSSWGALLSPLWPHGDETQYICEITHRAFDHFREFTDFIESGVVRSFQNDLDFDTLVFNPVELAAAIIASDPDLHWCGHRTWTNHEAEMAEWDEVLGRFVLRCPVWGHEEFGCTADQVVEHTEYVALSDYHGPTVFTVEVTKGGKITVIGR
jgi:hypothetical protein